MSEQRVYPVKKGYEYELSIDSLAFGGSGVARVEDYVVFVRRAIPGDKVKVFINNRKKSYAEATLRDIVEKSPIRQDAPCEYFEFCGGCSWQNMSYDNQLLHKLQIVRDALKRISGLKNIEILPVLVSDRYFAYRNKMEFSFAHKKWLPPDQLDDKTISKDFALGLHVPGTFDKILHIDHCLLQSDEANAILRHVSLYAQKHLEPYSIREHTGFLRFLVIRQSSSSGEIMVNIVTASDKTELLKPLANELIAKFEHVVSVVNNVNTSKAQIAFGQKETILAGKSTIEDKIGNFAFTISANSFFQTNTVQAENLYKTALNFAEVKPTDIVWDLYCGTGTISLFLLQKAKHVTGFELVESAIKNAEENISKYGFSNIKFIAGDVRNNMLTVNEQPDIIITDPPRAGMHPKVVETIVNSNPKRIVYISCNPTTMARDIKLMEDSYHLDRVQPVDMFPQTYHIECVAQLSRK